jgi:hypothetical protein
MEQSSALVKDLCLAEDDSLVGKRVDEKGNIGLSK